MLSLLRSDPVELRSRRLFITGGTGFLGRTLLDYLMECAALPDANFQATVLSRDPDAFLKRFPQFRSLPWLTFVAGDMNRLPSAAANYTDLIHAAADTHHHSDALEWFDQLVGGTRCLLDFACAMHVQRFLFVSSGAVYGPQYGDGPALTEDLLQAPLPTDISAVYAQGKRMAEHLCALYSAHRQLPCVIARCFAVISSHIPLDGPYAAGNFIRDALAADRPCITVRSDGTAIRTYLDGRDAAHWLFTLLKRGKPGVAYNVGSDAPVTVHELAKVVVEQLAPGKTVLVMKEDSKGARSVYVPDISRARALGLRVETPLRQSISRAAHPNQAEPSTPSSELLNSPLRRT